MSHPTHSLPLSLLPWPAQLQAAGTDHLSLGGGLRWPTQSQADPALQATWQRVCASPAQNGGQGPAFHLSVGQAITADLPQLGDDESYTLNIQPTGVSLQAATRWGALHGLHTLGQLLHQARREAEDGSAGQLPCLHISDAPAHPWRGLLVDVARRPLPMADLLRLLDGMAAAKLNVLHWHVCDDQAWRLSSERFPQLAQASAGFSYSLDEARQLVAHAAERGIRVVPELDLPGHCWALGLAFPNLLCPPAPTAPQRGFGIFPAAIDPRQLALWDFIAGLLDEWAEVFPDAFVHIGGDELAPEPWRRLGLPLAETQADYVQRMGALLAARGKRLVGWDELKGPGLPEGALLQVWRGAAALQADVGGQDLAPTAQPGLLRSAGFYLDQLHSAAFHWRTPLQHLPAPAPQPTGPSWQLQAQLTLLQLNARLVCSAEGQASLLLQAQGPGTLPNALPLQIRSFERIRADHWQLRATADCDMGELEIWCSLTRSGESSGVLRLGNLRHACSLVPLPADDLPAAAHSTSQRPPLLGGEAALWSELVSEHQLDLRLWPRAFAVAERLWSDPPPNSPLQASLTERLNAAADWAQTHAGVRHEAAQAQALQALCDGPEAAPQDLALLTALAQLLEPASGYGRHHSKKREGRYHLDEPLNRLADALPAESPWPARLAGLPSEAVRQQLQAWTSALPEWQALLQRHANLQPLLPLLPVMTALLDLGLYLWQDLPLSSDQRAQAQQQLHEAARMVDEVVPALVPALQARLDSQ